MKSTRPCKTRFANACEVQHVMIVSKRPLSIWLSSFLVGTSSAPVGAECRVNAKSCLQEYSRVSLLSTTFCIARIAQIASEGHAINTR